MVGERAGDIWDDVFEIVDGSDARIRRELVQEIGDVVNTIEAATGHRFNLEEAVREYVCKADPTPDLERERDAILLHVVCTWIFVLTEGWGLVCRSVRWDDLPAWVQDWYERANACDLVWLRRKRS